MKSHHIFPKLRGPLQPNILPIRLAAPMLAVVGLAAGVLPAQAALKVLPFSEAEIFFEENATDGDLGLHLFADGEGWDRLIITNSRFTRLVDVKVSGNLGKVIGLTELFSESEEPSYDELPREDFLALFPPGMYFFFAHTLENDWLAGVLGLTHDIPGEAVLVAPEEDAEVDAGEDLVLEWELVADPDAPDSVIEFYEVVVEKDEDAEGPLRVFSVIMLPDETTVRVPEEFLEAGTDYKVEIIAEETSGNRTAIEVEFATSEGEGGDED